MKIKELKVLLNEALLLLKYNYEEPKQGTVAVSVFSNLDGFRSGIIKLEISGLFKSEIEVIRKSPIFTTAKDFVNLNINEGRPLRPKLEELIKIVRAVSQSIDQIGGRTSEDSISIKFPNVQDFNDLSKFSAELHKILSQTILNDKINGQVRIDNVENGSIWFDVYLGAAAAVSLVGGLTWSAAVIYKKIQEGRIIEEHVRSLKIKNDSLKEIQERQKEVINMMVDAEANNLYNENFEGSDPEQIERLKLSIRMLSELIDRGAEIHPALNQPESVKNLYPDMKDLSLIESKIKKLKEPE